MIPSLMLYALVAGVALQITAMLLERVAALRRRPRRWVWAGVLVVYLMLVAGAGSGPHWSRLALGEDGIGIAGVPGDQSGLGAGLRLHQIVVAGADAAGVALAPAERLAGWLWAIGSAAVLLTYLAGQLALSRQRRSWRRTSVHGVPVLLAPAIGPAVVGVRSPQIVLPEWALALDSAALDLMIRHEQEHQHARDPLLIRLANGLLLLMPWNPVAWWMVNRLKLAVEIDCDARVLAGASTAPAAGAAAYGELLLAVAMRQPQTHALTHPAMLESRSRLARRIAAMSPNALRHPYMHAFAALGMGLLVLGLGLLVPVPQVRAQTPPSAPAPKADADPDEFGKHAYDLSGVSESAAGFTFPELRRSVDPQYTKAAMDAKIEGEVRLDLVVEADGTVGDIRIARSLDGTFGLDQEALDAAAEWEFEAATLNGTPLAVIVEVVMEFRLHRR
jgi:TonB family protein